MEFIDRILGITKKRQEKILEGIKTIGQLKKEGVGPEDNRKEFLVADVSNEDFLGLIREKGIKELQWHWWASFNDADTYNFYIDLGEGVKARSGTLELQHRPEKTMLSDLFEMGFRPDPDYKRDWLRGIWEVYRLKEK